ncbi:hypothetical protein K457DRAFT_147050 [Linnemannia elongata AG-77]|uniref:DUF985 domain-containing protein n=1 Tax=Linnemannia elongata AG-77 TaxID=1314771 RepID=A0A197JF32_9FUNG|nr:hypothetical protein K457DRAFT_147050 [Linnemannia elongata AG-77]
MSNTSTPNISLSLLKPIYTPNPSSKEPSYIQSTLSTLSLDPHIEGGYYALTDINTASTPSPYPPEPLSARTLDLTGGLREGYDPAKRLLSTSIFYYLTPNRPMGSFHRNRSRIIHTLSFVVGHDIGKGEKVTWTVEGGVWKASFLLQPSAGQDNNEGLLITETVVPGFEYSDHEFLSVEKSKELLTATDAKALEWLVKH